MRALVNKRKLVLNWRRLSERDDVDVAKVVGAYCYADGEEQREAKLVEDGGFAAAYCAKSALSDHEGCEDEAENREDPA